MHLNDSQDDPHVSHTITHNFIALTNLKWCC